MTTAATKAEGLAIPWAKDPIPHAEMIGYIRRFQDGDETAFEAIARHNGGFLRHCLLELYPGASYDQKNDLIHEGLLGLYEAALRFDETRGYQFISYAVHWIKQRMRKHLDDMGRPYQRPANGASQAVLSRTEDRLYQALERPPTAEELCEDLRARNTIVRTVENVRALKMDRTPPLQLLAPHKDSDQWQTNKNAAPYIDVFETPDPAPTVEDYLEAEDNRIMVARLLSLLPEDRMQRILRLYFGLGDEPPLTLEEIGATLGITRERVRQLKERAFSIIRGKLEKTPRLEA